MSLRRILEIEGLLEQLRRAKPQTAEREYSMAILELERDELRAKRDLELTVKTRTLLEAYRKHGAMRVILPNGQLLDGAPYLNVACPIQRFWNIRSEAQNLAMRATP